MVPELYGAALDRYTAEGDQLMNQYAMLGDLANDEYGRYQDALNQHWQNVSYLQGVADDEYGRQNDRYNRLVDLITTTGYTPNASELQNAGMSENEARAYANYYAQMMGGVGGSGGGTGGGGEEYKVPTTREYPSLVKTSYTPQVYDIMDYDDWQQRRNEYLSGKTYIGKFDPVVATGVEDYSSYAEYSAAITENNIKAQKYINMKREYDNRR